jgi:hypothetical protein
MRATEKGDDLFLRFFIEIYSDGDEKKLWDEEVKGSREEKFKFLKFSFKTLKLFF